MSHEERINLLSEIDKIRSTIETLEKLQSAVCRRPSWFGSGSETSRTQLAALRKELARDMEQLHAS
jgi:hypothetical protein